MLSRTQQIFIYLASLTKKKLIYEVIQPIQKAMFAKKSSSLQSPYIYLHLRLRN